MSLYPELVVRAADTPARYRPLVIKTDENKFVWLKDLVKGLFVGDLVTWKSSAGLTHYSVVLGAEHGYLSVSLQGWGAAIELENLVYVNGARVVNNFASQTIAEVEATIREEESKMDFLAGAS